MKILILYYLEPLSDIRRTVDEHLYSFKRYADAECYYINLAGRIPSFLNRLYFDLILLHYTACACRFQVGFFDNIESKWQILSSLRGFKAAIPQDEYVNTDSLCRLFKYLGVKTVFTCLPESEWRKVYPEEKSGISRFLTVFTGYVDEQTVSEQITKRFDKRTIDIGYRARKNPFSLGRHANLKWQLAEQFIQAENTEGLVCDISTDPSDVYYGNDWYSFLYRCRTILGCEGGASLHDPDGSIEKAVNCYISQIPSATFEEVEHACFSGLDGNLKLFAVSPRHFEACITKTCQVLVEGEYGGIFKPGIHYIEIKKDWSNITEVLDKIRDVSYCQLIAENAHRDIVISGRYSYSAFVLGVLNHVSHLEAVASKVYNPSWQYGLIGIHNKLQWLFMLSVYAKVILRGPLRRFFDLIGCQGGYQRLRSIILR